MRRRIPLSDLRGGKTAVDVPYDLIRATGFFVDELQLVAHQDCMLLFGEPVVFAGKQLPSDSIVLRDVVLLRALDVDASAAGEWRYFLGAAITAPVSQELYIKIDGLLPHAYVEQVIWGITRDRTFAELQKAYGWVGQRRVDLIDIVKMCCAAGVRVVAF